MIAGSSVRTAFPGTKVNVVARATRERKETTEIAGKPGKRVCPVLAVTKELRVPLDMQEGMASMVGRAGLEKMGITECPEFKVCFTFIYNLFLSYEIPFEYRMTFIQFDHVFILF